MLAVVMESMLVGGVISGTLYMLGRNAKGDAFRREVLATVGLSWLLASGIGGLPFYLSQSVPDFASAYFECASGLTTTGSSVFQTIEDKPRAILFWRSFTHFIGGLGIVVLFVALLPALGVGGRALFKEEATGPVTEGLTPRIKDTAVQLVKLYVGLNVIQMVLLFLFGMNLFDAANHAMATIATGGYSTRNSSIYYYQSPLIEWTIVVFMFLAGTNFNLHLEALKGKFHYFRNTEFKAYTGIVICSAFFIALILWLSGESDVSHANGVNIRDGFFTAVTIQTTTGFGTVNFDSWPEVLRYLIVILMFVGGCAGSTGGGLKVVRIVILFKLLAAEIATSVSPRSVRLLKLDGTVINRDIAYQVLMFFFVYTIIMAFGGFLVALLMPDQSLLTSFTAAITAINNIGPGLDAIGPTMNFANQSSSVKWILSLLMILGRLELYPILVLLSPSFWIRH